MKPLTTKAYDRRASGDCGTSGVGLSVMINRGPTCKFTKSAVSVAKFTGGPSILITL